MRVRLVALTVSVAAALALAASADGHRVETAPAESLPYASTTLSGYVAFQYVSVEVGPKLANVITLQRFRFRDACTKSLTRVRRKISVRHSRFSYRAGGISITGRVTGSDPKFRIIGTVHVSGDDCDADNNGNVAFIARRSL
jgi:hypothetical protein